RTRYLHLGKVALCQMSYARKTLVILARLFYLSRALRIFCLRFLAGTDLRAWAGFRRLRLDAVRLLGQRGVGQGAVALGVVLVVPPVVAPHVGIAYEKGRRKAALRRGAHVHVVARAVYGYDIPIVLRPVEPPGDDGAVHLNDVAQRLEGQGHTPAVRRAEMHGVPERVASLGIGGAGLHHDCRRLERAVGLSARGDAP